MEVGVKVFSEEALTGVKLHTCTAYLTTVAVSPEGRPAAVVPSVLAECAQDIRRGEEAETRRKRRLERVSTRRRRRAENQD